MDTHHYSFGQIDGIARRLHVDIWRRKREVWRGNPPSDPVALLDPGVVLTDLGYNVQTVQSIGEHFVNGVKSEVAGAIDQKHKIVHISRRFPPQVQRFTLAHELGHALCHVGAKNYTEMYQSEGFVASETDAKLRPTTLLPFI